MSASSASFRHVLRQASTTSSWFPLAMASRISTTNRSAHPCVADSSTYVLHVFGSPPSSVSAPEKAKSAIKAAHARRIAIVEARRNGIQELPPSPFRTRTESPFEPHPSDGGSPFERDTKRGRSPGRIRRGCSRGRITQVFICHPQSKAGWVGMDGQDETRTNRFGLEVHLPGVDVIATLLAPLQVRGHVKDRQSDHRHQRKREKLVVSHMHVHGGRPQQSP